ncbi:MAG TPA: FliM/FliN family flagellar motor switch protein [Gemmatimonadaceae bacterium]|nr:FliM/FliN family flagellar motor switch protein [Gemmatimonadaceae bacterium]
MSAPRPTRSTEQITQQLSQNDIDRLMRGEAAEAPVIPRPQQDVQVYDFRRPHRVSKERLHVLEAMYSRLVKSLEGWLMGRVRGVVDLKLESVEQISFGEYVLSLPPSCNSFIADIKDKSGADAVGEQAVIDIGRELAYFLVDRLFGGGAETTILDRALTPIERLAVRVVAERVMALVQEIWEDHVELELTLSGFESIPEIIQAAAREAPVLVTNITARFAGTESLVSIAVPLSVLEKFFVMNSASARAHQARREPPGQRAISEGALRATRVEMSARLPEFRLSMRDIAGLKAGSMLSTGIPIDTTVNLLVGNSPRFKTSAGRVGRKLAVRVLEPLSAEPLPTSVDDKP